MLLHQRHGKHFRGRSLTCHQVRTIGIEEVPLALRSGLHQMGHVHWAIQVSLRLHGPEEVRGRGLSLVLGLHLRLVLFRLHKDQVFDFCNFTPKLQELLFTDWFLCSSVSKSERVILNHNTVDFILNKLVPGLNFLLKRQVRHRHRGS